jgi:hypothetical protein
MNDQPTELTVQDLQKFYEFLINDTIKLHKCWNCSKDFLRNYSYELCDDCFFDQFPKDEVQKFMRNFLN